MRKGGQMERRRGGDERGGEEESWREREQE